MSYTIHLVVDPLYIHRLGTNTCDNKVVPTLLEFLLDRRIVSIACGLNHFMFVDGMLLKKGINLEY